MAILKENAYTERGAGSLGLSVQGQGRAYIQTKFGGQVGKYVIEGETKLYGFVNLLYTNRKGVGNANGVKSSFIDQPKNFTVFTGPKSNSMASLGTGFTTLFISDVYVTLGYNGEFGKNQRSHEGFIKIGKKF